MVRLIKALLVVVGGYLAGALVTAVLIELLSTNTHDKSLEVAMTAVFVGGPLGALAATLASVVLAARRGLKA